jgi:beta-glucosidase
LSYTTFELADCTARALADVIEVTGAVANTGAVDGADVVQVYARLPDHSAPRRLVGFSRIEVAAGETRSFALRIPIGRLAQRDTETHAWIVRDGRYELNVARHAADARARHVAVGL